jgi:hypothetical protein
MPSVATCTQGLQFGLLLLRGERLIVADDGGLIPRAGTQFAELLFLFGGELWPLDGVLGCGFRRGRCLRQQSGATQGHSQ